MGRGREGERGKENKNEGRWRELVERIERNTEMLYMIEVKNVAGAQWKENTWFTVTEAVECICFYNQSCLQEQYTEGL